MTRACEGGWPTIASTGTAFGPEAYTGTLRQTSQEVNVLISRNLQPVLAAAALAGAAVSTPVQAQDTRAPDPDNRAETPAVLERAANGRATSVRIGQTVYKVCRTEDEDGCIQPRAAGLDWGDRPLQSWPGRPASQMDDSRARDPGASPG